MRQYSGDTDRHCTVVACPPVTCTSGVLCRLAVMAVRRVLYIDEAGHKGRAAAPLYSVKVFPAGLEPATCGLEDRCSIQLSYRNKCHRWGCKRAPLGGIEPPTLPVSHFQLNGQSTWRHAVTVRASQEGYDFVICNMRGISLKICY